MHFAGTVAFVSGGGRGIGRAIALAFATRGATVAVAARTRVQIEEVAEQCRRAGVEARSYPLDVTQRPACDDVIAQCLSELGDIDVLVHCAGIARSSKFVDTDDETWRRTIDVDLNGPFYLTRAALPAMLARASGSVIGISSIAGRIGAPYIASYAAAKHGLIGMIRSLAAEYPRSGVTFNAVCPAYVDTTMTDATIENIMVKTGRRRDQAVAALLTPQGRLIQAEEVAALCLFLAGPDGRSINGQAINVDGGLVQS